MTDKPRVYMLVLDSYEALEPVFKKYAVFDVTDDLKVSEEGEYYGECRPTGGACLQIDGYNVELFYSMEGAVAFAAAHKMQGAKRYGSFGYERDTRSPPKP